MLTCNGRDDEFKSRMVRHFIESLAQLGERYPDKVDVIGSSPITFTNIEKTCGQKEKNAL